LSRERRKRFLGGWLAPPGRPMTRLGEGRVFNQSEPPSGFRSALACDAAQKMGYRNVHSLIGGYKSMLAAGWPMKSGAQ